MLVILDRASRFFLFLFVGTVALSPLAWAHQPSEGTVVATAGPYLFQTQSIHGAGNDYSPFRLGVGLLVEGDVSDRSGIEIGLFYFKKSYQRFVSDHLLVETFNRIAIPVGYRYWFSNEFSLGLFFNSLFGNGEREVIHAEIASSEATLAHDPVEYGFEASVQWEFWRSSTLAALLDGRYYWSLSARSNEDANQYGLMVGLKYSVQEKGL